MNNITCAAIKADREIPQDRRTTAIQFLEGKTGMPIPRLLVSQAEAARMLGMSRITIYRLVESGELTPVSIRGAKRYRVADISRMATDGASHDKGDE